MPLPTDPETPWPPTAWRAAYLRYGEHSAWYSGTPQELTRFYAGYAGQDRTGFFDPSTTAQPYVSIWRRFMFWARQTPGAITRIRTHVPIASDISTVSSDLLFADAPDLIIPEAHLAKAKPYAKKVQQRVSDIIEEDNIISTLLEGAEIASALGGVYLRGSWDKDFADDRPLLTAVHPDAVIPEFLYGRLVAATIWRVVLDDGKKVYRQLERYELVNGKAVVLTGLYKGSQTKLGPQVSLSLMPETTALNSTMADPTNLQTGLTAVVETGLTRLPLVYIPNMRPNRTDRSSPLGRSDYAGVEGLMDSLDETYTSWIRDLRLGRARLIVPEEYMQSQKRGQGSTFDLDREVFESLKMHPQDAQITPQQFAIRTKEHSDTAESLIERIVNAAGYSAVTFGVGDGPFAKETTATEVKSREHRTLATRDRKIGYWSSALSDIFELLLEIDQTVFSGPGVFRPRLEFPQTIQEGTLELANAVNFLNQAKAASLQTRVQMVHPDWDPDEVADEVARLQAEAATVPVISATPAPGAPGAPAAPGTVPPVPQANPPAPAAAGAPKAPDLGPMPPGTTTNPQPANPISQPAP